MTGVLLDTHTLLWLRAGRPMRMEAVYAIAVARVSQQLFIWQMLF